MLAKTMQLKESHVGITPSLKHNFLGDIEKVAPLLGLTYFRDTYKMHNRTLLKFFKNMRSSSYHVFNACVLNLETQ